MSLNKFEGGYYVYILKSKKDGSYYIGYSANLNSRLEKHNSATTGYTSTKQPWELVYQESYDTKNEALQRELAIKRKKSRGYIEFLIEGVG
ncbi:MAG: GIY-YIG nuclease family protein [Bacteroidota bacterium]